MMSYDKYKTCTFKRQSYIYTPKNISATKGRRSRGIILASGPKGPGFESRFAFFFLPS